MVPIPTVPPSSQPARSTVTSIQVRTTRSECPRAARPVISPSRGPGPRPAPMYRPVATPLSTTPDTMTAACTGSERGGVTTARTRSMTAPTTTTLHSVPRPGALPQRDPQQQDRRPRDDRPGPGGYAGPPGQTLVQHVPRVDAEPGQQQHRGADPVEDKAG